MFGLPDFWLGVLSVLAVEALVILGAFAVLRWMAEGFNPGA